MQLIVSTDSEEVTGEFTDEVRPVALSRITEAEEEGEESYRWQGLIDRARARVNLQNSDDDWEEYVPLENDELWEIGCMVSSTNILLISHIHKTRR